MIQQKDQEIQQKAQQREELNKTIEENRRIADDENEQPTRRSGAVKKLQKIPKGKPSLDRSKTNLNRGENRLRKGCPFESG